MIELRNVTRTFGATRALDALTLTIEKGDVFGFIGPNGAGKSTTMKILACLLKPDEGSARVCGLPCATHGPAIRKVLGYMPDFLGVYPDLRVHEYLEFFAAAFSMPRRERTRIVNDVLELTDLTSKRTAMVESLSRGMQQRLGIARVLIHDPSVLLLDEPASGLDPRARIEIRSLMLELQRMGKTIMVSSHILSELHEMCSSVGIIEKGQLLFSGSIDAAIRKSGLHQGLEIVVDDPERARACLVASNHCAGVTVNEFRLLVELSSDSVQPSAITRLLVEAGIGIEALHRRHVKLEDVFLSITKGEVS